MTQPAPDLEQLFRDERRFVWGLCYRMTGCAADADDLVQETFVRALQSPPARTDEPWRPWLVRVAVNLGRDLLRRRRRRGYTGPWLPSPIETPEESPPAYEIASDSGLTTEGRYELMESVSFAFLLALEALTPQQRAVLLLRDVFDYSVRDTADALGVSEANVKTTHHRARRAMRAYDRQRCRPAASLQARTRDVLERFLGAMIGQDVASIESLLAEGVRSLSDGGGEFAAARVPVLGRRCVARLCAGLARHSPPTTRFEVRLINGLPALVADFRVRSPRLSPRLVMQCEVDADGRIAALYTVLASRKLTALSLD